MAEARIYREPRSTMTSGRARTDRWVLEYVPLEAKRADPLTGWAGSGDTREQVRLIFPDAAAATTYAARHHVDARVVPAPDRLLKLQAYADNFR